MNIPAFEIHGGGDPSGSPVWILDEIVGAIGKFLDEGPSSFDLLPGLTALSTNVHPMIVHFPIALLTCYFLLDCLGALRHKPQLRLIARWQLYLGASGAIAAAASGMVAANSVPHGADVHQIMEVHERIGITIAGLSSLLAIWRFIIKDRLEGLAQPFHFILGAILIACITFGADLGGLMVYRHGVAVQSLTAPDEHHHSNHP